MNYASILNPDYEENVHTYATTKEIEKKIYDEESEKNQESGNQVTFILEIKL